MPSPFINDGKRMNNNFQNFPWCIRKFENSIYFIPKLNLTIPTVYTGKHFGIHPKLPWVFQYILV